MFGRIIWLILNDALATLVWGAVIGLAVIGLVGYITIGVQLCRSDTKRSETNSSEKV
jgi:hypothetical protein